MTDFAPGYFAMVMATGIVSIACHLLGYQVIARPLVWLNVLFYIALWALSGARCIVHRDRFLQDLGDHTRGPGFFTTVAATSILGNQAVVIAQAPVAGKALLALAMVLWLVLICTVFTLLTIQSRKPTLEKGINGTWLVAAVATRSVSVLIGLVVRHLESGREALLFISLCLFLVGVWRFIIHRGGFAYDPQYWSMVFPLGM